jgi:hypothetical protein
MHLTAPARFIRPSLAPVVIGLTLRAIEGKITAGVWVEGREFIKGPDGLNYIDLRGFERWVERGRR